MTGLQRIVARLQLGARASDAAALGGAFAIAYGAWLIAAPAGFIAGGVFLIAAAVLLRMRG